VIALIEPELRSLLGEETISAIVKAVDCGVTCMICAGWMDADGDGRASAVALRCASDGDTLIRFAHETCSPSRLIEVAELPDIGEPQHTPPRAELEWALSVRTDVLPMVVLVWALERIEQLEVTGRALLASLRLDGLTGGQPVETIKPPRVESVSVDREAATLRITTRHGSERLALGDPQAARPALQLAAHQEWMLLVVGEHLGLGGRDLAEVDRQLQYGDAVAAIVAYKDDELAAMPMHDGRARRLGRGVLSQMPSQRRRRRLYGR
jgi:hypothetical protein